MNVLHIDSSVAGERSASRALTAAVIERLRCLQPETEYRYRDLFQNPVDHYTAAYRQRRAFSELSAAQKKELALAQELIAEVRNAEVIVIGAPMYNLGIPSQLKAWFDHIIVPGLTFGLDSSGPLNLLGDKRVIVASTRGMMFGAGSPWERFDHQEKYLRDIFQFLGITNFTLIRAEGLGSPERREEELRRAYAQIAKLA